MSNHQMAVFTVAQGAAAAAERGGHAPCGHSLFLVLTAHIHHQRPVPTITAGFCHDVEFSQSAPSTSGTLPYPPPCLAYFKIPRL